MSTDKAMVTDDPHDVMKAAADYEDTREPDLMIRGEPFYSGAQFRAAFRHGYDAALAHPPAKREAGETAAPGTPATVPQTLVTLTDCPIGLFRYGGELCLKTEYGSNEGRIDAYIVSSGEFFWGGTNTPAAQRKVMVEPVSEIAVSPAPHVNVDWQDIRTAPTDGTVVNVVGRYLDATAGFPRYAAYRDGEWVEYSRSTPQPLICWAWRPRDNWPREGGSNASPPPPQSRERVSDTPSAAVEFDDEVIAYAQEIVDDREANGCKVYVSDVIDALRAALEASHE